MKSLTQLGVRENIWFLERPWPPKLWWPRGELRVPAESGVWRLTLALNLWLCKQDSRGSGSPPVQFSACHQMLVLPEFAGYWRGEAPELPGNWEESSSPHPAPHQEPSSVASGKSSHLTAGGISFIFKMSGKTKENLKSPQPAIFYKIFVLLFKWPYARHSRTVSSLLSPLQRGRVR